MQKMTLSRLREILPSNPEVLKKDALILFNKLIRTKNPAALQEDSVHGTRDRKEGPSLQVNGLRYSSTLNYFFHPLHPSRLHTFKFLRVMAWKFQCVFSLQPRDQIEGGTQLSPCRRKSNGSFFQWSPDFCTSNWLMGFNFRLHRTRAPSPTCLKYPIHTGARAEWIDGNYMFSSKEHFIRRISSNPNSSRPLKISHFRLAYSTRLR